MTSLRRRVGKMLIIASAIMSRNRLTFVGQSSDMQSVLSNRRVVHGEMRLCADTQPERKENAKYRANQSHAGSIHRSKDALQEMCAPYRNAISGRRVADRNRGPLKRALR